LLGIDTGEVVVTSRGKQVGLHYRTGGDHPHDFPREETFIGLVTDLLADGNMVPLLNQSSNVVIDGVERNARHGHAHALRDRARGQHDIQRL